MFRVPPHRDIRRTGDTLYRFAFEALRTPPLPAPSDVRAEPAMSNDAVQHPQPAPTGTPAHYEAGATNLVRRSLRRAAKHPVTLLAGPFRPGISKDTFVKFGNVSIGGAGKTAIQAEEAAGAYRCARDLLHADPSMRSMFRQLEEGCVEGDPGWHTTIRVHIGGHSEFTPCTGKYLAIHWNPRQSLMPSRHRSIPPALLLGHEIAHAYHFAADPEAFARRLTTPAGFMLNQEEALTHAREVIAAKNIATAGMREHYFDANPHLVDHPSETIAAEHAPWLAEGAEIRAATVPPLSAFPAASRARVYDGMKRRVAAMPRHMQDGAARTLREASHRELRSLVLCLSRLQGDS